MKKAFVISLVCSIGYSPLVHGQANWREGAFNTLTGQAYSFEQWMSFLPEKYDLFEYDEPLEVSIESNFKQLTKDKYKGKKQKALLYFPLSDSVTVRRVIRIEPRGEFRRKYCSPPPIKLNFKKTELYINSIQRLNKIKLVTNCKNYSTYQNYLFREYLTYQLYSLISELSFKTRLVNITYVDIGKKKKKKTSRYAFLIEEAEDMAKRNNMILLKIKTASQKSIDPYNMAVFSFFQYMIGNVDWSIAGAHNVKIVKSKTDPLQTKGLAVPYDFDYSGLVNATYAIPSGDFGINNVRQRIFRCQCYHSEVYKETIDHFISKKERIFQEIDQFPHLDSSSKKDVAKYIREFYDQIEGKNALKFFEQNCGRLL